MDNDVPDPIAGCNGIIADTHQGPGSWRFQFNTWLERTLASGDALRSVDGTIAYGDVGNRGVDTGVVGVSYISIPLRPKTNPDPKEHFLLEAQGIRGLAWGGGRWFAKGFSMNALSGTLPRKLIKRYIEWPDKGTVYARAPLRGLYPSIIVVNETRYTDDRRGDLKYRNLNGTLLNLKFLGG